MAENIAIAIEELLRYAADKLEMYEEDRIYNRNRLLRLFKLDEPAAKNAEKNRPLQQILDELTAYAVKAGLCQKGEELLFETEIMGLLTPPPHDVINAFDDIFAHEGAADATKYLNELAVNSNYIRMADIDKNVRWRAANARGDLIITINLAKPEKDPKAVAAAKNAKGGYPKCALCVENVGFAGNAVKAPRQTLRTIPLSLDGECWHFQFSPYVYFDNHCIALSSEHRPMDVNGKSFRRMFDFIEAFPHYFIGSNAALPIVGGSILSHDHYQGGAKVLPEMSAPVRMSFVNPLFDSVKLHIVDWYNSVIRLESQNRNDIQLAVEHILTLWNKYSDKSVNIIAADTEQHNAVTPIVRFNDNDEYTVDLILRNNRTDKSHPYGIFHPTEDLHNIKKEAIGIIEVMGLFILPGRLYEETHQMRDYLTGKRKLDFAEIANPDNPLSKHLGMITQLANDNGTSLSEADAEERIVNYINDACIKILDTTAVFKNDEKGQQAFIKFLAHTGADLVETPAYPDADN